MNRFLLVAALVFPAPLSAQRWLTLDASGGSVEHQFAPASQAASFAPRLTWLGRTTWFDGGFVYSRGTALRWNAEAEVNTGLVAPIDRRWAFGLDAEGSWTAHHEADGTTEIRLLPSLRFDATGVAAAVTLGGGLARTSTGRQPFLRGALESRGRVGPFDIRGRVTRTRFTQEAIRAGVVWISNGEFGDTLRKRYLTTYDDVDLRAGWSSPRFRIEAGVERRLGPEEFRATGWYVEGTGWLKPQLALFGGAGRTLSRLTVDLPARAYTTIGIRWFVTGPRLRYPSLPPTPVGSFRAERAGSLVRFLMPAPHAATIEIMGDFANWEPLSMLPDRAGWWILSRSLAPGLYRVNVRIDGGMWRVPPGLPAEEDGFGGRTGLLLVP